MGISNKNSFKKLLVGGAMVAMILSSTAIARSDNYGAIAYSSNSGAHGYSYDYNSRREAENAAMDECYNAGGSNCVIATWVRNGCGALAVGSGGAWGGDFARNRNEAEQKALNICYNNGNNCRIDRWVCVTR